MLRSMGRAPGDVAVDGGAEKVCEPRLPKLPPRPARASASVIANANTPATAQSASSGRTRKESMKSSQKDRLVPPRYWYPLAALEEVPHGVAAPATCRLRTHSARPRESEAQNPDDGLDSQHKRVHARLDALCAGMSGGPGPRSFHSNYQKIRWPPSSSPSAPGSAMGRARSRCSSAKRHRCAVDRRGVSEPVIPGSCLIA